MEKIPVVLTINIDGQDIKHTVEVYRAEEVDARIAVLEQQLADERDQNANLRGKIDEFVGWEDESGGTSVAQFRARIAVLERACRILANQIAAYKYALGAGDNLLEKIVARAIRQAEGEA